MAFRVLSNSSRDQSPRLQRAEFSSCDQHVDLLQSAPASSQPQWRFSDLALSQPVLDSLRDVLAWHRHKPTILTQFGFHRFMKPGKGIVVNFSGPSGTGKSSTAEALAFEAGMSITKVDASAVVSSTLGGSSKALAAVIESVRGQNTLLFFDEADRLLSGRFPGSGQAADSEINSLKGRLITLLDSFDGIIVFATNFATVYDSAFRRRIIFQVPFALPNAEQMRRLLEFHLQQLPHEINLHKFEEQLEGLSGGDVKALAIRLATQLVSGRISRVTDDSFADLVKTYRNAWKE